MGSNGSGLERWGRRWMWFWRRKGIGGRASVLAQRAASEGPRWTRAVEAHPPVPFVVIGGGKREKARSSFFITILLSVMTLNLLSACPLFVPRGDTRPQIAA